VWKAGELLVCSLTSVCTETVDTTVGTTTETTTDTSQPIEEMTVSAGVREDRPALSRAPLRGQLACTPGTCRARGNLVATVPRRGLVTLLTLAVHCVITACSDACLPP
jgi:hypothetical protein